jgi:hypothetical protein
MFLCISFDIRCSLFNIRYLYLLAACSLQLVACSGFLPTAVPIAIGSRFTIADSIPIAVIFRVAALPAESPPAVHR